jgi:NAD dependent epimerase/dehydratase family enzyme
MAEAILLSGTRVLPEKLNTAGYTFKHAELKDALTDVMKG